MAGELTALAIDMGSSSMRGILASWNPQTKQLTRQEVFRVPHSVQHNAERHLVWDIALLRESAHDCLNKYAPNSVGVDGWGVDYVLVDAHNEPVSAAIAYRDESGAQGRKACQLDEFEHYQQTGVFPQDINSIYRLVGQDITGADSLMFLADYVARSLVSVDPGPWASAGVASTSGLLDAAHQNWATDLEGIVDYRVLPPVRNELGVIGYHGDTAVIRAGSHDTGCAVYSLLGAEDDAMFVSLGSWAVVGAKTEQALVSEEAWDAQVTNEARTDAGNRAELNLTGLWIAQECRRAWGGTPFKELDQMTAEAQSTGITIDVNDPDLATPGNMPAKVAKLAADQGIQLQTQGEVLRLVSESVAKAQADAIENLRALSGNRGGVYIMGGGVKDSFLLEKTAAAIGEDIYVCDSESTALGNILAQLVTLGVDPQDLAQSLRDSSVVKPLHL